MRNQHRLTKMMIASFTLAIVALISVFFVFSSAHYDVTLRSTKLLEGNLSVIDQSDTRALSITLPEEFESAQSIFFKTTHTCVEVCVDRERIYVSDTQGNPSFLDSPGTRWHIVDLPQQSDGKTLSFYLMEVYDDYFGNDLIVHYGSNAACYMHLLLDSLPIAMIAFVSVFIGLLCLLLHALGIMRKTVSAKNSFMFVGLFALTAGLWSVCQCGALHLYIKDAPTLYFVDMYTFYLFPVCFNLFLASICKTRSETFFCVIAGGYMVEMVIATILQFMGIVDIFLLLPVTHLLMAVNVLCVLPLIAYEIHHADNRMAKKFVFPLMIVMTFAAAELVAYYINDFRNTSIFLPLGTIVFIIMLVWILLNQYYESRLEEQKMAYLRKLANTDMLTDVFNRNAYENTLKRLEQQEMELRTTCVVLFDINNMKQINDYYGHECGDQALKISSRCIQQAFGPEGSCYRIGGDEFVFIGNDEKNLSRCAARFEELIRKEAHTLTFPLSVAVGYASYDVHHDHALRDVIRRSDEMMYHNKKEQKENMKAFELSTNTPLYVEK